MIILLGYLYLVNFSVSSTRAYIMLMIWVLYRLTGIRALSLNVVCLAGLSLLIIKPDNFTDIGFTLSISVVLAIIWINHKYISQLEINLFLVSFKLIL